MPMSGLPCCSLCLHQLYLPLSHNRILNTFTMTLIKTMRRRNEAMHAVKAPRARSQERPLQDNEDDFFLKLEKRYLSDSSSTDTEDDSQSTSPDRAMTDPLTTRKHYESFPTLPRFPNRETGDKHCWSEPHNEIYSVRGRNYLQDGNKVESGPYLLRARGCDLLLSTEGCAPPKHVGRYVVVLDWYLCRFIVKHLCSHTLP